MLTNLALAAAILTPGPAFDGPSASLPQATSPMTAVAVRGDKLPDAADAVSFKSKDGQLLSGSFYAPKRKKKTTMPSPAVLLLHDAASDRAELEELAAYLHKKGFAVLTVDLRGHGQSQTEDCSFAKADEKGRTNLWSLSARDVDAAASFLLEQDSVHASNLSICGVGAGAALAVRHAVDDENVRSVILVNPETASFGYNVGAGVTELGGLPTLILAPKDRRDVAEGLVKEAHAGNDGLEFVSISRLKSDAKEALKDKKLDSQMAAFLREKVMPKK